MKDLPFQATQGLAGVAGAAAGERLGWALFVALAAHGLLILGVGFAPPSSGGPEEVPTLEVMLLEQPVPDTPPPEEARYLAQASEAGGGNVEDSVPPEFHAEPPSPEPQEAHSADAAARQFASSWLSPLQLSIAPLPEEPEPTTVEHRPEGGLTRVAAVDLREHFISVDARESVFAEYLAGWKARMERLGTLNFPAVAQGARSGNPVLEVAVAADGHLAEVRVTRSSGHPPLDQAAVDLVRLASPFDPFPAAVRAQYDVLRFSYEWRFLAGRAAEGVLRAPEP